MPKGYNVPSGYMGWIPWYQKYMLFASEADYLEWIIDAEV